MHAGGKAKTPAHWVAQARERLSAIEQDVRELDRRLRAVEATQARIDADEEITRIDAEVAWIETAAQARQIQAEVEAAAIWLEATTPHYPRM